MWANIATGTVVVILVSGILRYTIYRMDKMVTKDRCKERHDNIIKDLDRGEEQFKEIKDLIIKANEKLAMQGEAFASMAASFKLYQKFFDRDCK